MNLHADSDSVDEAFVYPWMGILANIPRQRMGSSYSGQSGGRLKSYLTSRGFNPNKVIPSWDPSIGFSGYAIVVFESTWLGFANAMLFHNSFAADHQGRIDFFSSARRKEGLYGWIAQQSDYDSTEAFGKKLKAMADLKTISQVQAEEQSKHVSHLLSLFYRLANTTETLQEMQAKRSDVSFAPTIFMPDQLVPKGKHRTQGVFFALSLSFGSPFFPAVHKFSLNRD